MARSLTLADGQLAVSSATLLSGADLAETGARVDVLAQNVTTSEQTVVLTLSRAGGTARRVARVVLAENEGLLLSGLAMQPDDTLAGYTSSALCVDYVISRSGADTLSVRTLDAEGNPRQALAGDSVSQSRDSASSIPVHDDSLRRVVEEVLVLLRGKR